MRTTKHMLDTCNTALIDLKHEIGKLQVQQETTYADAGDHRRGREAAHKACIAAGEIGLATAQLLERFLRAETENDRRRQARANEKPGKRVPFIKGNAKSPARKRVG